MGALSQSSRPGDGSRAWGLSWPGAGVAYWRTPDRPRRHGGQRPWVVDIGRVVPAGSASCSPTRKRRNLNDGATEMLGRVIVYAWSCCCAASLLLEQPIPMAIGP